MATELLNPSTYSEKAQELWDTALLMAKAKKGSRVRLTTEDNGIAIEQYFPIQNTKRRKEIVLKLNEPTTLSSSRDAENKPRSTGEPWSAKRKKFDAGKGLGRYSGKKIAS